MTNTFDKTLIENLYKTNKLSIKQISEYLGCDYWKLFRFFRKEKISIRSRSDATRSYAENTLNQNLLKLTKDILFSHYITEGMSSVDIAKKYNTSYTAVIHRLKLFDIPMRNSSNAAFSSSQKHHPLIVELTKEKLINLYVVRELSMPDIGELYKIDKGVVKRLLKKHGIKIRDKKEAFSTKSYKKKKREKLIQQIKSHGFVATFNPSACRIIEEYGKQKGWNFRHALNGGEYYLPEIGYWLDGYDKENNIVCEYYEKQHRYKIEYDKKRKQDILNFLKCKMIIIHEDGKIETF